MKRWIFRILIMILSGIGLVWFSVPVFYNIMNIGNIMAIVVCAIVFLTAVFYEVIRAKRKDSKAFCVFSRAVSVMFCIGVIWATLLTACMLYGANTFDLRAEIPQDATVVVLGSKVNGDVPSADLMARINEAGVYLKTNKHAKCIASGGQGAGEIIPEAEVIKKHLVLQGVDGSRIIIENQSKTTVENLRNSLAIIEKRGFSRDLAIVTDEYHQFRASRVAKGLGVTSYAVCAKTPRCIFSACYARELLALSKFLIVP